MKFSRETNLWPRVAEVSLGTNVLFRDNWGQTALYYAVESGHLPMARFPVDCGASLTRKTKRGREGKTAMDMNKDPYIQTERLNALAEQKARAAPATGKRRREEADASKVCRGGPAEAAFVEWTYAGAELAEEPVIAQNDVTLVAENASYFLCLHRQSRARGESASPRLGSALFS